MTQCVERLHFSVSLSVYYSLQCMFIREGYISEGLESFNSSLNKYLAVAQTQYIQSVSAGVGGGPD